MARTKNRKRSVSAEYGSSDEDAPSGRKRRRNDDDDWKPQRKSNATGKGKKRRDVSDAAEYMEESELTQTNAHPISLHVIPRPEPLREALLNWYDRVHALRGMPWRKPYNHAWDAEQKAQRAYEVRTLCELLRRRVDLTGLCRYGCQRSCCSRPKLPQSYRITTSGWKGMVFVCAATYDPCSPLCRFPTIRDLVSI